MPHIHEKIDFIAEAYIVHGGKVLLRQHDKYKIWAPVGGHIELDEDPTQTAVREAKEEVGLDIEIVGAIPTKNFDDSKDLVPPRFMNRHRINETHEHVSFLYFATTKNAEIEQSDADEISDDIRWLTHEQLDDPSLGISERIK